MVSGKHLGRCASFVAIMAASPALAEARQFDIPAGDLRVALKAYIQQSRTQLIFRDEDVRGKVVRRVAGSMPPEAALDRLLIGTGLSPTRGPDGAVMLGLTQTAALSAADEPASSADIVVTAQKRSERIQDVPIAISAFTQETLDKQKIEAGPDILKAVPNLTFSKSNFAGYNLSIRGIGTKAVSVTTDPGVAINFNSTTLITNRFFEQEFFDLERIEVLRGPQGTLYGRNATGGVVNIISNKADLTKFDGYLKAEVGNFGSRRAQGAINVPIVADVLGLRLAGAYTNRDGFTTNDITMNRIDGRDLYTTRATLTFKPINAINSDFIWERFSENDSRARTAKQLCHRDDGPVTFGASAPLQENTRGYLSQGCKPGSLYDDEAFGVPNGQSLPYVQLAQDPTFGFLGNAPTPPYENITLLKNNVDPYSGTTQTRDLRRISSITDPKYRAKSNVFELNTSIDVLSNAVLTLQTAYNSDKYYSTQDYNRFNTVPVFNSTDNILLSTIPITPGGIYRDPQLGPSSRLVAQDLITARAKQFSQEVRLATTGNGPLQGTVGGNYTHYKNQTDYYVFINVLSAIAQAGGAIGNQSIDPALCPIAVEDPVGSGQFVSKLVPTNTPEANAADCIYIDPNPLRSINGQGHNYFRSSNRYKLDSYGLFADATYALTPKLKLIAGARYNDDVKTTRPVPSQLLLGTRFLLAGTVNYGYPEDPPIRQHFRAATGRIGFQWEPNTAFTDDSMVYGTLSRGYKAGGTNPPPIGFNDRGFVQLLSYPATFRPEYVNSLELGTKNTLFNNRLTLNLTGYFYDFSNYQVSQIQDRQAINENFDSRMYGVEAEILLRPSRALSVNANLGLQGSRIGRNQFSIDVMDRLQGHEDEYTLVKAFVQLPSNCVIKKEYIERQILENQSLNDPYEPRFLSGFCPGAAVSIPTIPADAYPNGGRGFYANIGGNQVPNAPHFTADVGAEYNIPITGNWVLTPRADFYHQSGSYARVYNTVIDRLRGWENVNLSIRAGNPELGLLIEAYVKNVFDSTPITDAFINSDDTGLTTNVFTFDPRIIGVNVTKKF